MSCFVVTDDFMNRLLSNIKANDSLPDARGHYTGIIGANNLDRKRTEIGRILFRENYRSYNALYKDPASPEDEAHINSFVYNHKHESKTCGLSDIVQGLKDCDCFDYQACENKDYETTHAAMIVNAIRRNLIRRLPGYDAASWAE